MDAAEGSVRREVVSRVAGHGDADGSEAGAQRERLAVSRRGLHRHRAILTFDGYRSGRVHDRDSVESRLRVDLTANAGQLDRTVVGRHARAAFDLAEIHAAEGGFDNRGAAYRVAA